MSLPRRSRASRRRDRRTCSTSLALTPPLYLGSRGQPPFLRIASPGERAGWTNLCLAQPRHTGGGVGRGIGEAPLRLHGHHDRRGASPWRSDVTTRGVKKMSTSQPFGPPGASAAAEAVEAHVTVPPIPIPGDVSAQRETAAERGRTTTGERP
jgi:hypothetical protein